MSVRKIASSVYRYVLYGKQIGNTAANGTKVYKRGKVITGVASDGNVIRKIRTFKSGPNSVTIESFTPIPYSSGDYFYSQRIVTQGERDVLTSVFRCRKSAGGNQESIYGTPWFIEYTKDRKTGAIKGIKNINSEDKSHCYCFDIKSNN